MLSNWIEKENTHAKESRVGTLIIGWIFRCLVISYSSVVTSFFYTHKVRKLHIHADHAAPLYGVVYSCHKTITCIASP